jgi:hypothetical protein
MLGRSRPLTHLDAEEPLGGELNALVLPGPLELLVDLLVRLVRFANDQDGPIITTAI